MATKWPTATVILTDQRETMELLTANIAANGLSNRCVATEMSFGDDVAVLVAALEERGIIPHGGAGVHIIVASDCQFTTQAEFLWEPFVATLASSAPHTQVYISLQERHGTCGERLEPFLNALGDLVKDRNEQYSLLPATIGEEVDTCCFVELFHPALGEGSHAFDSKYPNRCLFMSL